MMKQKWFLLVLSLLTLFVGQAFGMDFRADITGPGAVMDAGELKILPNTLCSLNVYSTNNDTIINDPTHPQWANRTTWSSAFQFTGNIAVQWQEALPTFNYTWSDAVTTGKFASASFIGYWDIIKGVYTEDRDGNLPDNFDFSSIASGAGYPPNLGEQKILWWGFQTANTSGQLCIEQLPPGIIDPTFDWLFDDPQPTFPTTCFNIMGAANQPPVLAPIGPKSVNEGVNLNFGVSATDADGTTPILKTSSPLPTGATFTDHGNGTGTFDWTPTFSQSGSYPVTFWASDGTDSVSELVTITVNNVNQPPVLAAIGPKSVDEGINLNFGVSASDPDGTTPILTTSTPLPTGATFTDHGNGTGTFDWTPGFTQSGVYDIVFRASDGLLLDTEIVVITVNDVNQPPVLAAIGPKSVDENVNLNFGVSATDIDGTTPILITSIPLPTGATFTDHGNGTGTFDWTPTYSQSGVYNVTFIASDGLANDSEIVVITVNNVNLPPVLAQIATGPVSIHEGDSLGIALSAVDPDGQIPTISSSFLPPNAVVTDNGDGTGFFIFKPDFSQAGIYPITFYAFDGSLFDSELVVIEVIDVPVEQPCLAISPDSLIYIIEWCNPINSPMDTINFKISNCGTGALNWIFDSVPNFINVPKMSGTGADSFQITFKYFSVPPADTLLATSGRYYNVFRKCGSLGFRGAEFAENHSCQGFRILCSSSAPALYVGSTG